MGVSVTVAGSIAMSLMGFIALTAAYALFRGSVMEPEPRLAGVVNAVSVSAAVFALLSMLAVVFVELTGASSVFLLLPALFMLAGAVVLSAEAARLAPVVAARIAVAAGVWLATGVAATSFAMVFAAHALHPSVLETPAYLAVLASWAVALARTAYAVFRSRGGGTRDGEVEEVEA